MNIFTAKIRGHVVMQHLESLHSLHSLPLLSTFYLLKKNCTHHVLFCKMTISIIINEGQKITKFFDLSLRIFEEIIVIRLGRFLLIFRNSCFGKTTMVEASTFCHARSSFFVASKIKKTGGSFPLLKATTNLCNVKKFK